MFSQQSKYDNAKTIYVKVYEVLFYINYNNYSVIKCM